MIMMYFMQKMTMIQVLELMTMKEQEIQEYALTINFLSIS